MYIFLVCRSRCISKLDKESMLSLSVRTNETASKNNFIHFTWLVFPPLAPSEQIEINFLNFSVHLRQIIWRVRINLFVYFHARTKSFVVWTGFGFQKLCVSLFRRAKNYSPPFHLSGWWKKKIKSCRYWCTELLFCLRFFGKKFYDVGKVKLI